MKNIYKIVISLVFCINVVLPVYATEIPKAIVDYIKTNFPNATVRFDGVVELPDGTAYLPVMPFSYAKVENPEKIVMTLPENVGIDKKPDLILFANDLSLLKVIKKSNGTRTLISSPKIPLKVKLGLLPQDLVVPENLVIPAELRVIIGDLKISIAGDANQILVGNNKTSLGASNNIAGTPVSNQSSSSVIPSELKDLVNKTFYATNIQSSLLYVIFPQTGRPIKTIQLSSIPSDIAITSDNRYILVSGLSSNTVSIIDTSKNSFVNEIQVGKMPMSIVIPRGTDKAYVANRASSLISVIDLTRMSVIKEISVKGAPSTLTLSEDQKSIFYNDPVGMKIYRLTLMDPDDPMSIDSVDAITEVNIASKILQHGNHLLILSRSDNALIVYDLETKKVINTVQVGNKPVDMNLVKEKNKIYVLSAGSSSIDILDVATYRIIGNIPLKEGSFFKSINVLSLKDKALISSIDSYEVAIVDLNEEKVIDYLPVGTTINNLLITQPLN